MSLLVYTAAAALKTALEADADLFGKVKVLQQLPDRLAGSPCVGITEDGFDILPWPSDEVRDEDDEAIFAPNGKPLFKVGELVGAWKLWVGASRDYDRQKMMDAVIRSFFGDDQAPGRILTTIPDVTIGGVATGFDATVAHLLDEARWDNELVFSERFWVHCRVLVDLPLLVLRTGAAKVTEMYLALTTDITTDISALSGESQIQTALANYEKHRVLADGTLTAP